MGLVLSLDPSGSAEIVESDGNQVILVASLAFPPGSTLVGASAEVPRAFRVKVRGSRRVEGASERPFRVEGRFVDITREQREVMLGAIG